MRPLKVYTWQSVRLTSSDSGYPTREIVAAPSQAAVARIAGVNRPAQLFNLCETGNAEEIALAMAEPGVVFWKPIDGKNSEYSREEK